MWRPPRHTPLLPAHTCLHPTPPRPPSPATLIRSLVALLEHPELVKSLLVLSKVGAFIYWACLIMKPSRAV
jgi:hypothetical protein